MYTRGERELEHPDIKLGERYDGRRAIDNRPYEDGECGEWLKHNERNYELEEYDCGVCEVCGEENRSQESGNRSQVAWGDDSGSPRGMGRNDGGALCERCLVEGILSDAQDGEPGAMAVVLAWAQYCYECGDCGDIGEFMRGVHSV